MTELSDDVRYMKGIGEQRAKALDKLGVRTLRDLISYFPRTYEDRTKSVSIAALEPGQPSCIHAMVASEPTLARVRRGMEIVKLRIVDDTGSLDVTYFNQSYVRTRLVPGRSFVFYGRLTVENFRKTLINPLFEPEDEPPQITGRIVPIYRLTSGISQKVLSASIRRSLDVCAGKYPDYLPEQVTEKYELCQPAYAYENIHFPSDFGALELARRRLIFEELFVLSTALARIKRSRVKNSGVIISTPDMNEFYSSLPFAATGAQTRAINDALKDMSSGREMNRLIQGDVGSGKTLVAAACVWCAFKGGLQSAFMAPTEILASQHVETFTSLLAPLGVRVSKLTGSMPAKQKREVLESLKNGETDLIIGTHALISDNVEFHELGLVVTDEQHRFGVNQRASLISKGRDPHTLVMSATPIPRTLALMIYGDLDVSVIDELPPGRQKVDTFAVGEDMRERIYAFMRKQVSEGRQVFVVCPAIDEGEETPPEIKTAKEYAKTLSEEIFPDLRVGCVHGKLKSPEKDKTMRAFADGEIDILVSTTVVEVGVDVPNASLMVVENADRFGLSQLHQLRGRVGRGKHKSYCVLFSEAKGDDALARLKIMEQTSDGFKISEEDLKLRGPGDFFGSRQHGLPAMYIADLCTDVRDLKQAQEASQAVLEADPELERPEDRKLKERVDELFVLNESTMN